MAATSLGITYPDSTGHVRLWEHIQATADTTNAILLAPIVKGAWTAFTLTNAGSTGLTIGNGTQACAYRLLDDKTATFRILLSLGSTSVLAGTIALGPLPFTASAAADQIAAGWWYRSGAAQRPSIADISGTQIIRLITDANAYWTNTNPLTYGANDQIRVNGTVELA